MKLPSATRIRVLTLGLALVAGPLAAQRRFLWNRIEPDAESAAGMFGSAVAVHRNLVLVGSPNNDRGGEHAGAAHLYRLRFRSEQELLDVHPADPTGHPAFGTSVALGPGILAVGAPGRYASGASAGFVEIYERRGRGWAPGAVLTGNDTTQGSHFGVSLALDGDSLVVGAPGTSVFPGVGGAVYVFERLGGVWHQVDKLLISPWDTTSGFGSAVALDRGILAVGAPRASHVRDGGDRGTVYVYRRENDRFTGPVTLRGGDERSQSFGRAVAVSGGRIAVGAPAIGTGISSGESAVYLFTDEDGAWRQAARLRPDTVAPGDRYGSSVALGGRRLFAGAPFTQIPGPEPHILLGTGVIYSFRHTAGEWTEGDLLRPPGFARFFGRAVDVFRHRLIAGAPRANPQASSAYTLIPAR